MSLTKEQLEILRAIKNGSFGSVNHNWGYLKKNGYIDFDATDDGITTRDPVLTDKGKRALTHPVVCFWNDHWKWIITTLIALSAVLASVLMSNSGKKVQNNSFTNSPVVAGNVGAINYNTPVQASYLNERSEETSINDAEDLVGYYFESYNRNKFQEACSLLKKIKCDASNASSIQDFSRFADKLSNGYENIQVNELSNLDKKDSIVCVKYSYGLKTDPTPSKISEIFSYYVAEREDGYKEITSRVCEKKHDSVLGDRRCPIEAEKKYCLNAF